MFPCCELDLLGPETLRRWLKRAYWAVAAVVLVFGLIR
jgi:hypothetical protein